jgi:hypothetical protein
MTMTSHGLAECAASLFGELLADEGVFRHFRFSAPLISPSSSAPNATSSQPERARKPQRAKAARE